MSLEEYIIDSESIRHQSKGFTLVELLVSIGIIGALAGLLLGALMKAKDSADEIKTINKMSQIYKTAMLDSNDYDGRWVASDVDHDIGTTNILYQHMPPMLQGDKYLGKLRSYADDPQIFFDDSHNTFKKDSAMGLDAYVNKNNISFGSFEGNPYLTNFSDRSYSFILKHSSDELADGTKRVPYEGKKIGLTKTDGSCRISSMKDNYIYKPGDIYKSLWDNIENDF